MTIDVLIIGAGPNGLLLAGELALAGVHALVLERLVAPDPQPRANGLVGTVVRALDHRGLYERFSGEPGPPNPVPYFPFGGLTLDMSTLADNGLYALPIPQHRMVQLLAERAGELGVKVRRGHELTGFCQTADEVTADVRGPDGAYQVVARFLVGADGGRSVVRKQCGIDFPGVTDDSFVGRSGTATVGPPVAVPGTGELEVPGLGRLRPANFHRTPTGVLAFGMFQPGVYRFGTFEWGQPPTEASESIPLDELRDAVARVLGTDVPLEPAPGGSPGSVGRRTVGINSRQADRYRDDRVFLVGDAAHVHSGVGGPGLNLGMQDAFNLAWKLAEVVAGRAPDGLLDSYHRERHPVGQRVIMHSRAQHALLAPGANVTALRELLGELLHQPTTVRHVADLMSGAEIRYDTEVADPHPLAGRWAPDLVLHTGSMTLRVAEVMRAARAVLLDLADDATLREGVAGWTDRVNVLTVRCEQPPAAAILIRPDGYVAWAGDPTDADAAMALRQALHTWFGEPR